MFKKIKRHPEWMLDPPKTLAAQVACVQAHKDLLKSKGPKGRALRQILKEAKAQFEIINEDARQKNPIALFKPSYEQALILNAHLYGISFICLYTSNRIGKTTADFLNIILWIFPNDPKYQIFQPYTDHLNRLVEVLPRPDISRLDEIRKALVKCPYKPDPNLPHYDPQNQKVLQWLQTKRPSAPLPFPAPPWNKGGTIWVGAPDQAHHEQIVLPLWKQYLPKNSIDRYSEKDKEITIKITQASGRTTYWELIGKSYESKDTKWASGAVDAIVLTEGVKSDVFKEIKLRFKDPGVGGHDFTPYEPANSGDASALAHRIFTGKEILPVPYHVFSGFSVRNAPDHIISKNKRDGLIKSFADDPEGAARIEGNFYTSSALVLSHLNREFHLLDGSVEDLFKKYPDGRIYRGIDPGLDHPTACAWGLLIPTGQWIIYRIMSQRGLSIPERCKRIIEMSNNNQTEVRWGKQPNQRYMQETHDNPNSEIVCATVCDYHTFKEDEVSGQAYALHYILQGLQIIESVHTGPEDRAMSLNSDLKPSQFYPSPQGMKPPGSRVYFLREGIGVMSAFLKWEEFYWERYRGGDNKGQPKDKIPDHGDDELDAVTYITNSPFSWTNYRPPAKLKNESEPEHHLMQSQSDLSNPRQFATIANRSVSIFGASGDEYDREY